MSTEQTIAIALFGTFIVVVGVLAIEATLRFSNVDDDEPVQIGRKTTDTNTPSKSKSYKYRKQKMKKLYHIYKELEYIEKPHNTTQRPFFVKSVELTDTAYLVRTHQDKDICLFITDVNEMNKAMATVFTYTRIYYKDSHDSFTIAGSSWSDIESAQKYSHTTHIEEEMEARLPEHELQKYKQFTNNRDAIPENVIAEEFISKRLTELEEYAQLGYTSVY